MDNVNTEGKKLIEELIQKLKHSDERNQELRKALHAVDEQCEKLVARFFIFLLVLVHSHRQVLLLTELEVEVGDWLF